MRTLPGELARFIRIRIPLIDKEIKALQSHELFQMAFAALVGVGEVGADNTGKMVELIQRTVGLPPGTAWCMAAAQAAIRFVEVHHDVVSPIASGGHCLTVADNSRPIWVSLPLPGDLILWRRGDTTEGHTEAVVAVVFPVVFTIGGNTSNGIGIQREGDTTAFRMRRLDKAEGDMRIYTFLRPFQPV